MTVETYLGVVGVILSLSVLYYSYKAIRNFKDQGSVSLALNIPHGSIQTGLKLMLAGFLILVLAMMVGRWGIFLNLSSMKIVSKIGVLLTITAITVFLRALAKSLKNI